MPVTGGIVNQQGVVQTIGGGDPINALQNLTKQPVPPRMTQPGGIIYQCILSFIHSYFVYSGLNSADLVYG